MTKFLKKVFFFLLIFNFLSASFAQGAGSSQKSSGNQTNDYSDDFDSIFDIDDESVFEEVPTISNDKVTEKKGIVFSGNLESVLGGYIWLNPVDFVPGAIFESVLSFTSRPTDNFSIKGSILCSFPKMDIGLYELFFTYNLFNFAYVSAGKQKLGWGYSKIFDTNILNDKNDDVHDPQKLLHYEIKDPEDSKFTLSLFVPFWKINLTALLFYNNYGDENDESSWDVSNISNADLSYAGNIEFNLPNMSLGLFGRMWAINDSYKFDPAIGTDVNFQIKDLHFYTQYVLHTHFDEVTQEFSFPRMKGTASLWWFTREIADLGFILEYQVVADENKYVDGSMIDNGVSGYLVKHYLAFEGAWGNIFDSKFTLGLKYFHDFYEEYGTIIPGVKIRNFIPNTEIDLGFPIYYGSQNNYGLALQIKLNVDF